MQQRVHYTDNTDAIAVMWKNKNKSIEELKRTIICRHITYNKLQVGWTFHSHRSDSLKTGSDNFLSRYEQKTISN